MLHHETVFLCFLHFFVKVKGKITSETTDILCIVLSLAKHMDLNNYVMDRKSCTGIHGQ